MACKPKSNHRSRFVLMGILNVTPDSFYDGGRFISLNGALKQAEHLVKEGADILDVGGESTRPGSKAVSIQEEKHRVIPVIKALVKRFKSIRISIDTYKSDVAHAALNEGASILNDISAVGGSKMLDVVHEFKPQVVLMHMQGNPHTMQKWPRYKNVVQEVKSFLQKRVQWLVGEGLSKNKIWIDPGIGFGKTVEHNLQLLSHLKEFCNLGVPVLVGCSRKSFIGKVLAQGKEILKVEERLEGSLAAACWAYVNGASIFRVHDVAATKRALSLIGEIRDSALGPNK